MTAVVSLVRQVGEGFVHCAVGVSWKVWPYATSVIVERGKWVGTDQTDVDKYPKRPVGHLCETNYASLTKYYRVRSVM